MTVLFGFLSPAGVLWVFALIIALQTNHRSLFDILLSDICRIYNKSNVASHSQSVSPAAAGRLGECGQLHHAPCCLPAQVRGGGRETGLRGRRGWVRLFCVRRASCGWLAAFPLCGVMFSARLGPSVLPPLVLHSRCCSGCLRKHDAGAPPAPTHSSR